MRTKINVADDAMLVDAVSQLVRAGAEVRSSTPDTRSLPLRGRFAVLPQRDEIITPEHVRELMGREGI